MPNKPIECETQTESWSCGLLSWAALLRLTPNQLIKKLSPDAQKMIKLNELAEELQLDAYGLPMEHFIPVAKSMLKGVCVYDLIGYTPQKAYDIIKNKEGIIVYGLAPEYNFRHAVCWDGEHVQDPDSGKRTLTSIYRHKVELFYSLFDIKKTDLVTKINLTKEHNAQTCPKKKW